MPKEPVLLTARDIVVLIEAVMLSEKIKPSQQAKRDVFRKHDILGSRKDPPLTALFYKIMLRQGIIDKIISDLTGVPNPLLLDKFLRSALRVMIELELFSKGKVRFSNFMEIKNRVSAYLSSRSHPYVGMWFWETLNKVRNYELKPLNEDEELMFNYMLPKWYMRKMMDLLGKEEAIKLFRALNRKPHLSIRVNTLKSEINEVLEELSLKGKKVEISKVVPTVLRFEGPYNFDESKCFKEGKIVIQEEAAALASIILNPKPGEVVVDLCAAPGGKTEHMGELMKNDGLIYAFDIDSGRIKRMKELLKRTDITIVKIFREDSRKAPRIIGYEIADKVLVDAPCSSDGTLMKNPELRWRILESEVPKFAQIQYELLKAAIKLVKPGGYILYTTCSLLREENEDVITRLLSKEGKKLELVPLKKHYDPGLIPGTLRVWPHKYPTIGFFYALLRKKNRK
jgi:16S rRNA (cytosine967-C5)-methyltransferase